MITTHEHMFETQIYPDVKINPCLLLKETNLAGLEVFMTGQWMFVSGWNSQNGAQFLYELPWSIGLISPIIFDVEKNNLHESCISPEWYKSAFKEAYRSSKSYNLIIKVHKRKVAKDIWFVNCLLPYYGDCVSLLLRTGPLKYGPRDLVALVPSPLVRMVPDWYAEVWEVIMPCGIGYESVLDWNPSFNELLKDEFRRFKSVAIPHLFQPASPGSTVLNDFLDVKPFNVSQWSRVTPTVTFLWREDRLSPPEIELPQHLARLINRLRLLNWANHILKLINLYRYRCFIVATVLNVLKKVPDCRIYIIGKGLFPGLPKSLIDNRVSVHSLKADQEDERIASESHVLISSHGSHLVALSALPGCVIQLIPQSKWNNWLDALSIRDRDSGGWVNYLSLPSEISPDSLASILESRLLNGPMFSIAYSSEYAGLRTIESIMQIRERLAP